MSSSATAIGLAAGIIISCIFQAVPALNTFWGGGIMPGIIATSLGIAIGSAIKPQKT